MSVESWGRGRPDYFKSTVSSRPAIIEEETTQQQWGDRQSTTVYAMGSSSINFYTVPTGYNLALGTIDVSCDESCINEIQIKEGDTLLQSFKFDMRGGLSFTSIAGQIINEENILVITIYNNNAVHDTFNISISGVLEKVRA